MASSHSRRRPAAVPSYSASVSAPFATAHQQVATAVVIERGGGRRCDGHPLHTTHATFEQKIIAQRNSTSHWEKLVSYHEQQKTLTEAATQQDRAIAMRKIREIQRHNEELQTGYQMEQEARDREKAELVRDQDAALAKSLSSFQAEVAANEYRRRRVCESSAEIKALTEKIAAAQLNQERHKQLSEKQKREHLEKSELRRIDDIAEAMRINHERESLMMKQRAIQVEAERVSVLRAQMEEKEQMKQNAYIQFECERQQVQQVVEQIEREEQQKQLQRQQKQAELKESIAAYLRQRAEWREAERRAAERELSRILEYQSDQEKRRAALAATVAAKNARDDLIYQSISADLAAKEKERDEMERMLAELYSEEREQEMMRQVEAAEIRAKQLREQMKAENEASLLLKQQRIEAQKKEEQRLKQEMQEQLRVVREDEFVTAERRKREKVAYQQEIERMMKAKRDKDEQERQAEEAAQQKAQTEAQEELKLIEQERERLLNILAKELKDYLPKGVFKNKEEFHKHMQQTRNINNNNNSPTRR